MFLFSNRNTRRHPEPRIPPASRSVQILYRISGMLNESNRCTHRWWYVSCFTTLTQMGIVNARLIFYEWLDYKKFSLAVSPHHLAKCVICIFTKFVCFSRIRETRKNEKWRFSHSCKIVKNIKKFSYTWFISPRIIYCLVPRQPPTWPFGGGYNHGDPSRKVYTFRDVEIFTKFGLCTFVCTHYFS